MFRLQRNESEKLGRDRLNSKIHELEHLLPVLASASRKVDKCTILRHATNYLRFNRGRWSRNRVFCAFRVLTVCLHVSSTLLFFVFQDIVENNGLLSSESNPRYLRLLSSVLLEVKYFVLSSSNHKSAEY